jgi:hypothetical protein
MEKIDTTLCQYPEIAQRIFDIKNIDQEMRKTNIGKNHDAKLWRDVDSTNTALLKEIINTIGWPTVSKVGKEASESAWLIAQHADLDVIFQKECFELMKKEPETEVSEVDIAYLHDRICVNEKRPQFFGTQFYTNEYGAYGPRPIEDIEHVDERRASIGLDSMSEYKKRLEKKYENHPDE